MTTSTSTGSGTGSKLTPAQQAAQAAALAAGAKTAAAMANSVMELAGEGGLEAVTIRAVARRVGVSIGAVQHHYPTKQALLIRTWRLVCDARVKRVREIVSQPGLDERARLMESCQSLAVVDADSSVQAAAWLAFLAKAITDPELAEIHQSTNALVEALLGGLLAAWPERSTSWSPGHQAAMVMALLDGLAVSRAADPARMSPGRAWMILKRFIGSLEG